MKHTDPCFHVKHFYYMADLICKIYRAVRAKDGYKKLAYPLSLTDVYGDYGTVTSYVSGLYPDLEYGENRLVETFPNDWKMYVTRKSYNSDYDYVWAIIKDQNDNVIYNGSITGPIVGKNLNYCFFGFCEYTSGPNAGRLTVCRLQSAQGMTPMWNANAGAPIGNVGTALAPLKEFMLDEYPEDPYILAPESNPDGGYGDFDYKSDIVPLPSAPSISISDSGFITLYKPTLAQLQSLAAYMWSGLFDMATFRKIFADPMDCIISLALMPITPTASGSQELKVGNIGTGITIDKISTQFAEVTFDSLNIGLRSNSFMDYSPYTKAQIYLPFIGTRSLSIDDIVGKDIKLKYIIDLFTGACNASIGVNVTAKDGTTQTTTLYQFTGNVLANVPVTANNFASFLQATIGAVSTAIGVATGAGTLPAIASAVNAATSMKPDIEKSGNLSATAGFLGVQKPYLILTYPNLCRPNGRDKVTGTPSFLGLSSNKKLSAFHGFTQLHRINVKGISCTEAERQMILSQLTGEGVILP